MKIKASQLPDITDFNMRDCVYGGRECLWIFPHLEGVKWKTDNLMFRSSIWAKPTEPDGDYELVSAGFKKFFNWAQEPDIYPAPNALTTKIKCVEKLDGSCLIVSKFNGELIVRTRRANASTMLNGDEIEYFKLEYPEVFNWRGLEKDENDRIPEQYSLIFEWLTPSNQIVVKYDQPEIRLIGAINHEDYSLVGQWALDAMASALKVKRPKYFNFSTIQEMIDNVAQLKGEEGLCVYYGNDQHIRKIKSDWYLSVHNFRNAMNLKNIVDLYFIMEQPTYDKFCEGVMNQFAWEGLQMAKPLISQVCDAMKEVHRILDGMKRFIDKITPDYPGCDIKPGNNVRKAQADRIIRAYGETSRADIVFTLLDKKPLNRNQWKKLLFQCLT